MSELWRDTLGHLLEIDPNFVTDGGGDRKWMFGHVVCPEECLGWWRSFHENSMVTVVLEADECHDGKAFGWWRVSPVTQKEAVL